MLLFCQSYAPQLSVILHFLQFFYSHFIFLLCFFYVKNTIS
ncbi:hypothetical protein DORFOR_01439 [Dorea formicigenerans ATCC 27755]|uniref:Uncharacterized protein n=1 Tax=Dorea formicigenerans ATCC 27755 TaxID=411461 RepID=B0G599_9FIRM|nr:hypothetical protein DORFOR_01439 [Dorea formicigenerans ATCC 27755]